MDEQRVALVRRYFMESGVFGDIEVIDKSRRDGPRSDQESDPIWAIAGCRAGK